MISTMRNKQTQEKVIQKIKQADIQAVIQTVIQVAIAMGIQKAQGNVVGARRMGKRYDNISCREANGGRGGRMSISKNQHDINEEGAHTLYTVVAGASG
jgi:hypothetical protein